MSFNSKMGTITVNDITYDVEEQQNAHGTTIYTLERDSEPVFEGIKGRLGYEQEDASMFSPRDWSNVGTMAIHYSGYKLGDKDAGDIDFDVTCPDCEGTGEREEKQSANTTELFDCDKCGGSGEITLDPASYFRQERGAHVVIGLFVYEHSGITISAGPTIGETIKRDDIRSSGRFIGDDAGWDTSFVGFIFDTPQGVKDCLGEDATDEQIEKALHSEVEVYASYLEGDVTWWSVEDSETDFNEGCGGFVGCHDSAEEEMYQSLEQAIVKRLAEIEERAHWAARDTVTVKS